MIRPRGSVVRMSIVVAANSGEAESQDPYMLAAEAGAALRNAVGSDIDVAVVLGSGWRAAADVMAEDSRVTQLLELPMADLPGFVPPTAEGHGGTIRVLRVATSDGSRTVAVCLGRTHAYEGHALWRTAHAVRTVAAAGARSVVLTNAAGGLVEGMQIGEPVVIRDHINMTGKTPLVGARFVNLVDAYSPELRAKVQQLRPGLREAVYAMMPGPQYETPAEIHMLRVLGAGLVGMSTVYETIAAREAGLEVLGISLVTNLAAGMTGEALNHEEVLEAGVAAAQDMGRLMVDVVLL